MNDAVRDATVGNVTLHPFRSLTPPPSAPVQPGAVEWCAAGPRDRQVRGSTRSAVRLAMFCRPRTRPLPARQFPGSSGYAQRKSPRDARPGQFLRRAGASLLAGSATGGPPASGAAARGTRARWWTWMRSRRNQNTGLSVVGLATESSWASLPGTVIASAMAPTLRLTAVKDCHPNGRSTSTPSSASLPGHPCPA